MTPVTSALAVPPRCTSPCPEGCDLACERPATWRPVPGVPFVEGMSDGGVIALRSARPGGFILFSPLRDRRGAVMRGTSGAAIRGRRVGAALPQGAGRP